MRQLLAQRDRTRDRHLGGWASRKRRLHRRSQLLSQPGHVLGPSSNAASGSRAAESARGIGRSRGAIGRGRPPSCSGVVRQGVRTERSLPPDLLCVRVANSEHLREHRRSFLRSASGCPPTSGCHYEECQQKRSIARMERRRQPGRIPICVNGSGWRWRASAGGAVGRTTSPRRRSPELLRAKWRGRRRLVPS